MLSFLRGFNANVWVLMILELFERLAYYGVSFTLSTFSVYMLNLSMSTMNILVNLTYVLSPLAALVGGGMSDGKWGRKWVLLAGSIIYTLGLSGVASSAMPWLFSEFPNTPSDWAVPVLIIGLALVSVGYGCMKVCLAPLLADAALVSLGRCCTTEVEEEAPAEDQNSESSPHAKLLSGADEDGNITRISAGYNSTTGTNAVRDKRKSGNGCQCGCQEGGVCACNQVVTEERNKAFEHVVGNARRSILASSKGRKRKTAPSRESRADDADSDALSSSDSDSDEHGEGKVRSSTIVSPWPAVETTVSDGHVSKEGDGGVVTEDSQQKEQQQEPPLSPQERLEADMEEEASSLLSRLFRLDYFIINFGSIIGIGGAPFLRDADPRTKSIVDEDDGGESKDVHVGYYIGFWVCAGATLVGTLIYLARLKHYPMNQPSRTMLIAKVSWSSFKGWRLYRKFQRGTAQPTSYAHILADAAESSSSGCLISSDAQMEIAVSFYDAFLSPNSPRAEDWVGPRLIMYAQFEGFIAQSLLTKSEAAHPSSTATCVANGASAAVVVPSCCCSAAGKRDVSSVQNDGHEQSSKDLHASTSVSAVAASNGHVTPEEAKAFALTMALCVSFSPLPVYWLLATQFSSNVVMQSGWMDLPENLPPEIFNNVNTGTILVLIPLMDFFLDSRYKGQRISVVSRMTIGFLLMFISMGFCAALQIFIDRRGTFLSDAKYVLNEGEELISALWLIIPFVLQGAAAVFVDTTSVEAAYTAAPSHMKSTVMAVYLLASAGSGFLGLAFAPFISAENMALIMLILCGMQLAVTFLFWGVSNGLSSLGRCCSSSSRSDGSGAATSGKKKAVLEQLNTQ